MTTSDQAFDDFSRAIASDPIDILFARMQRERFMTALKDRPEVDEIVQTGSLARETTVGVIKDVDLVIVLKASYQTKANGEALTPHEALVLVQQMIQREIYGHDEDHPIDPSETNFGAHVVKCDNPGSPMDEFRRFIPAAPPVDVMPAFRDGSQLRVPEKSDTGGYGWTFVDPEHLTRLVAERQREWKYFDSTVQMIKVWADHQNLNLKSVTIEVLVLTYMPRPRCFETPSRGKAIERFFAAAAEKGIHRLADPARGAELQPGMDYGALRHRLTEGAAISRQALDAQNLARRERTRVAESPDAHWGRLFGPKYPRSILAILRQYFWPFVQPHNPTDAAHPVVEPTSSRWTSTASATGSAAGSASGPKVPPQSSGADQPERTHATARYPFEEDDVPDASAPIIFG